MSKARKNFLRFFVASIAAAAALWVSGVRLFAFAGESMSPAVRARDRFVGLVGIWGLRPPQRFEMVILDVPENSKWYGKNIPSMKRLIGLPGEHVRVSGSQLFVDGRRIEESPLHIDDPAATHKDYEVTLGDHEYLVLGDNLDYSYEDSRSLGPIERSRLKGVVAFVIHSPRTKK